MKYNLDKFFFRLTVVISVLIFIVMVIYANDNWVRWIINPVDFFDRLGNWIELVLYGLIGPLCVWGIYFIVRWICLGLKK